MSAWSFSFFIGLLSLKLKARMLTVPSGQMKIRAFEKTTFNY